jgi:uncharacterized spore protein YtfJ
MNKQATQATNERNPLATAVVEGEPIRVSERELVPVVRVTTYARRRAFVGSDRLAGQGWGFVRLRPIAILERSETGERRIPLKDKTAQMLGGLLLAAFIVPLLLGLAARLMRRGGRG